MQHQLEDIKISLAYRDFPVMRLILTAAIILIPLAMVIYHVSY